MKCLERKILSLNSYIGNKGLQTVIYKFLLKEYQKKSKLNPKQAKGSNKIRMETTKKNQENQLKDGSLKDKKKKNR